MPFGFSFNGCSGSSFDNGSPPEQQGCGCQIVNDSFQRNDSDPESDRPYSTKYGTDGVPETAELSRSVGFTWAVPSQADNNWQISSKTLICSEAGAQLVCLRHSRWWTISISVAATLPTGSKLRIYPTCDDTTGSTYVEWYSNGTSSTLTVVGSDTKTYTGNISGTFACCVAMLASSTESYILSGSVGGTTLTVPIETPTKSSFVIELVTGSVTITNIAADNIGPVQVAPANDSNGVWDHTAGTVPCGSCAQDCGCPSSSTTGTMTVTISGVSDGGTNDFGYDSCTSGPTTISGSGDDAYCYGCVEAAGPDPGWPNCYGVLASCFWFESDTEGHYDICTPTTCAAANAEYTLHWQGPCSWSGIGTAVICCGPPAIQLLAGATVSMTYDATTNKTTITGSGSVGGGEAIYTKIVTGRVACSDLEGMSLVATTAYPPTGSWSLCNWHDTTMEIGSVS